MTGPQIPDGAPAPQLPSAPRKWKLIALILVLILLAPASWLARRAASRMEFFQLRSVAVEGTRYLSPAVVVERLAVDTSRSVWDDTEPLAEKLRSLPQVSSVEISRRLPGTLVVTIHENLPVALAPSPRGLEAVDSIGIVLPIDLVRNDVDLPIANQRDKAILALLTDTRSRNPMLYDRISEITKDGRDGFVLTLAPSGGMRRAVSPADSTGSDFISKPASLKVRASVGVSVARLTDIFPVESDLMRRRANVAELDLRYRDQVIARLQ